MPVPRRSRAFRNGWDAALREIEHQAAHWDTPEHAELGRVIAEALRASAEIARSGGLNCEHRSRPGSLRPEPPVAM
jgi:hypothetical protein